ncbi:MAG: transglutaminase-like cysteine peptidase [Vogesella sp.]|jgi:predicted transglutaminase-like cysteine proteinase|uniref:transglutaminase-like cysteine peptidase n=1 Tax=Vogesella sp. TaxID=1904252 RepID=UPI0011C8F85F
MGVPLVLSRCKWLPVCLVLAALALAEMPLERVQQLYGGQAVRIYREWQQLLLSSRRESNEQTLLRDVNQFFNQRYQFVDDIDLWKQPDYWATPLESMARGAGDCEDYTIAKYFTLRELGVAPQKLRLTYVKARLGGAASTVTQAHMVLAYYPGPAAEPLILDNLISTIRPASQRTDLQPVFSFNADGIWVGGGPNPNSSVDRLTRWRQLIDKMKTEGFIS